MPDVGDIEYKYRRTYIAVNPNPGAGPLTWRVASPQEIGAPGGGGGGTGGGVAYDFDGVPPINIDMKPGAGTGGRTIVETSMDMKQLDDRTT